MSTTELKPMEAIAEFDQGCEISQFCGNLREAIVGAWLPGGQMCDLIGSVV